MKVGDKAKVKPNPGGRSLWAKLVGATGTVKVIQSHYIQLEIIINGHVNRYNFAPNELVKLKPLKLKQFGAWK